MLRLSEENGRYAESQGMTDELLEQLLAMRMSRRIVVDTNVYVSRFIRPVSIPGLAVVKAVRQDQTLISLPIWMELRTVFIVQSFPGSLGHACWSHT